MKLVVALVAALMLAAPASAASTPAAYRAQANAVCAKANAQEKALTEKQSKTPSTTSPSIAPVMAAALAIERKKYIALRALQPPASLVAAHRRALGYLWQALSLEAKAITDLYAAPDSQKPLQDYGKAILPLVGPSISAWRSTGALTCLGNSEVNIETG
jgi:hypothetical protein